jgi:transcription initiation factor TFIIIB Brf1 subunit/transcription initiation factor TFIIB
VVNENRSRSLSQFTARGKLRERRVSEREPVAELKPLAQSNLPRGVNLNFLASSYTIMTLVVLEGRSVDECAAILYGVNVKTGHAQRSDAEDVGRRLKIGLSELAALWFRVGPQRQ